MNNASNTILYLMMTTTTNAPLYGTHENQVRWTVIGYRESVFQACQGAPIVAGGCCDKCGASIRYVVTVKSDRSEVMDVGTDCAITLKGGPDLADIRRAERAYEHELFLKSPEYARQQAERIAREAATAERKANAETVHAGRLAELRAIVASGNCSDFEKNRASRYIGLLLSGAEFCKPMGDDATVLRLAASKAKAPASLHLGAVGGKVEAVAMFEGVYWVETAYGPNGIFKFRAADGAVLVWFTKACELGANDVGSTVRIKGTVKAHADYRGVPETTLVRCKVERVAAE